MQTHRQARFAKPCALGRTLGLAAVTLSLLVSGCGSRGGAGVPTSRAGNAALVAVHHGRLVDVYGLREVAGAVTFSLYRTDVLVGSDIQDQRQVGEDLPDEEIIYDFISPDPRNLQPRLLIPRDVRSVEFRLAFERLDNGARSVSAAVAGPDSGFSIMPRNGGLRLTFSGDLGIDDGFFVAFDDAGQVVGLRNAEAVQLLEIVGDPNDGFHRGDFRPLPVRIGFSRDADGAIKQGNQLIIDPVILGEEGPRYQTGNNPSGLPEAPGQLGANIRIAVALEGPLAIPGIREDAGGDLTGFNNAGRLSVIRDLRSGHRLDDTPDIDRGLLRDPTPPRIVGKIPFLLERVEELDATSQLVTVFKNGRSHEIDRGDVLHLIDTRNRTGIAEATTEVIEDPEDDRGRPSLQHVRVRVRRLPPVLSDDGRQVDPLEELDLSDEPDYPLDPEEREAWLVRNATSAGLIAEFTASRTDPLTGTVVRDEPRNFITFSPGPLQNFDGTPSRPGENVSPYAGAIIRFTKPMDFSSVRTADSFFFGTRDLLNPEAIERFKAAGGRGPGSQRIDAFSFNPHKFRTPHLVASRVFDEDGSQTTLRLQPILGFYMDDAMRADEGRGFDDKRFKYFLHLLGGDSGLHDIGGNPIDFQADTEEDSGHVVIPFSLDTRMRNSVNPVFEDNRVVSLVRTYNDPDEDEQPSYYQADEVQPAGSVHTLTKALSVPDIFGAVVYLDDGRLQARPTSRIRKVVDDLNQVPAPDQTSEFRWCPSHLTTTPGEPCGWGERQIATPSASRPFSAGIQNPLNPYGSRVQAVWRDIDLSLSPIDPFDMNLDVEQLYWAPLTSRTIRFDELDRVSLFLGHSEWRPEPCMGACWNMATMPNSGLQIDFAENYVHNNSENARPLIELAPPPHPAYVDVSMRIDSAQAITETNGINRFLPLPAFQKPYFVWRDETVMEQGGATPRGVDTNPDWIDRRDGDGGRVGWDYVDYIPSPFLGGHGRVQQDRVDPLQPGFRRRTGTWSNAANFSLITNRRDTRTGGLLGSIALPLLADFWTYCDSPDLPMGNGFLATGINGWQVSISMPTSHLPAFRTFSGGFAGFGIRPPICIGPGSQEWDQAYGGYDLEGNTPRIGGRFVRGDNSVYWVMADFLKRATVATSGFVEITNPHRMREGVPVDPRLGPYTVLGLSQPDLPSFTHSFDPPLDVLPGGTTIDVEYRGAGVVDPDPWRARWDVNSFVSNPVDLNLPDPDNFPLDPLKAGDAHIRKYDERPSEFTNGIPRHSWTYLYNRTVTSYTGDLNTLMDPDFTEQFSGPFEDFTPQDVKYFNWRFLMSNNVETDPPISPALDTFAVVYRFERSK